MAEREQLLVELEQQRRSLAMLPPGTPLSREEALELIARCQAVLRTSRRG